jgi:predicted metal-dependent hydrolase
MITLNGREVEYELERKRVKNINLRIRSDGSVYVSANSAVTDSVIEAFLVKKAGYILSALDKYADIVKYAGDDHSYVTGESYGYLGKDLRLVVTNGKKNNVSSDGVYLTLSVTNSGDNTVKRKLIGKWYDAQCKLVFDEVIAVIYPIFQKYGVGMPKLRLRDMTSRWGSCQPKRGAITLNKRLIEAQRNCIEYVVMHEFIHFLHPNHSKKFYDMLSALMPDWKERKRILESINNLPIQKGI